jgi:hypothetical protein
MRAHLQQFWVRLLSPDAFASLPSRGVLGRQETGRSEPFQVAWRIDLAGFARWALLPSPGADGIGAMLLGRAGGPSVFVRQHGERSMAS